VDQRALIHTEAGCRQAVRIRETFPPTFNWFWFSLTASRTWSYMTRAVLLFFRPSTFSGFR